MRSVEVRFKITTRVRLFFAWKSLTFFSRIAISSRKLFALMRFSSPRRLPRKRSVATAGHGLSALSSALAGSSVLAGTTAWWTAASNTESLRRSQPPKTMLSSGASDSPLKSGWSVTIPTRGASPIFMRTEPATIVVETAPFSPTTQTPSRFKVLL